jgi:2-oxoglutarate dehydrogenase E2 component (dihydrolipoamide succinyltransferase)
MATKVEIPPLGESITEAVLAKWLKPEGASVKVDEPLCELETDKANVELPAPVAGVLRRLKKEGETVKIAEAVAAIEEGAGKPASPVKEAPAPKAEAPKKTGNGHGAGASSDQSERLSPAVRAMVEENKVNAAELKGSGPNGRVLKEDVMRYLQTRTSAPAAERAASTGVVTREPAKAPQALPRAPVPATVSSTLGVRREPMSKIRKKIAERLVAVQHQAAMLTTFNEVDMSAVLSLREKYKERFTEAYGVSLGLMGFFARASALALKDFPVVNASIDGEDIVYHDQVNLGIAVSTDRGLVVPVLHKVESMSFGKVESEIKRMAGAAREGKLSLQELSGGTFTITNGGVFGSMMSTPILNAPQSGILGMHAILKRPVAVGDEIQIRPMMYLALSYDHRLVDGKDSVSFLVRIKQLLEDPARLLLEV